VSERALRRAAAAVAAVGLALAAYLTWVHYHPAALVCTKGGGCETVQQSHYATLVGIPVALLGLVLWATALALVVWDTETGWTLAAALAVSALGFALYLVVLQLAVIHAVCWWCMGNDVILVPAFAALVGIRLLRDAEG
jgi:uncharacterized membrane protein